MHDILADALGKQRAAARGALDDAGRQGVGGFTALAGEHCRNLVRGAVRGGLAERLDFRELPAGLRFQPGGDFGIAAEIEDGQPARRQVRVRSEPADSLVDAGDVGLAVGVVVQQRARPAGLAEAAGQLADAFAAGGDGGQHRDAEFLGKRRNVDGDTARRGFVVHVERQHHRHAEFGEQRGQGQRAAQVLGVADLDETARLLVEQGAHRRPFVVAARGQSKDARRVEQHRLAVEAGARARDLDGGAGVVGNIDVGAGQPVKEHRLADIGVADEEDGGVGGGGGGHDSGDPNCGVGATPLPSDRRLLARSHSARVSSSRSVASHRRSRTRAALRAEWEQPLSLWISSRLRAPAQSSGGGMASAKPWPVGTRARCRQSRYGEPGSA